MSVSPLHPSARALLTFFEFHHLPPHLAEVSKKCYGLAHLLIEDCGNNAEFTAGLRKLLEAKDCFVRSALQNKNEQEKI